MVFGSRRCEWPQKAHRRSNQIRIRVAVMVRGALGIVGLLRFVGAIVVVPTRIASNRATLQVLAGGHLHPTPANAGVKERGRGIRHVTIAASIAWAIRVGRASRDAHTACRMICTSTP